MCNNIKWSNIVVPERNKREKQGIKNIEEKCSKFLLKIDDRPKPDIQKCWWECKPAEEIKQKCCKNDLTA